MTRVAPNRRPVNMVFQHYALFPHLTVAENVAFGLRYQRGRNGDRLGRPATPSRVERALALVQLGGYGGRRPGQLSGGQRQRVALARALVLGPEVLLLDEPLGALDQKLRQEMQVELKNLQRTLGITFVFVTHDQEEALTMSDRIAVMNRGRVEQVDASARLFERPRTEFVAEFMGAANFFTARVDGVGGGVLSLRLGSGNPRSHAGRRRRAPAGRGGAPGGAAGEARPAGPRPLGARRAVGPGDGRGPDLSGGEHGLGGARRRRGPLHRLPSERPPGGRSGRRAVPGGAGDRGLPSATGRFCAGTRSRR